MRISYDWLKTMIDIPEDPKTLSDEYIRTGTEVEAIDTVGESFDHVVTAKVLTKTPHPDSDHMYVCSVDVGDKNLDPDGNPVPLQIVCGAQNFEARRPHRHGNDRRRASRRRQDQEEQASRRCVHGHELLRA